ncbi:hypothetical protein QO001_000845 [Methylobacterium brachiatum]|jgi:hypothetical protein|uniref:Holin of 3TMs, for gene-transfer release n=1 Tax=Methylobacterium brachiatum TaxID=269660 RepID=A0AAJ1TRP1_9HYPH|nr:3TM-type holin [Methylobacterium brachiatum]MCB4803500.1 holin family protein [Methylobacterium brachiatum]MDQ0541937.1 hypothetical protein [Methylobacterium brachiatum]
MASGIIGTILGGVLTGGAGPALGAGIGAAIPSIAEIARVIVDRTIPDPQKKAEAQAEIEQALATREAAVAAAIQAQNEQQNAINLAEAQGNDRFSSRWRPTLGWACVAAFVYQFLAAPLVTWLGAILGVALGIAFPAPPTIVVSDFMPVLIGMLGLGAMRTYERTTGVPGAVPAPQTARR